MSFSSRLSLALAFLSLSMAGAPAWAAPATIPAVADKEPLAYPAGEPGRPAVLQKLTLRFDNPTIGELQKGWLCGRHGDVAWNKTSAAVLMPIRALAVRFRGELEKAGYPVVVVSDSMFEEKKEGAAEAAGKNRLQVGMLVKEIAANLCDKGSNTWTGEAYLKVFWQVYAPEMKKVVFEGTTEGSFKAAEPISGPLSVVMVSAFGRASHNLLAEPGFLKAVSTPADPAALAAMAAASAASSPGVNGAGGTGVPTAKLQVEGAKATAEPFMQKITQLRMAVATVVTDRSTGSGFFIGKNDLLMTNQHVVGGAKFVKVRLPTGRELIGEVLRADALRDVALVKTEPAGVPPIPVRLTEPNVGEEVFALGSPLGDKFNTSLTKGVLSGMREVSQQRFIQSDVAVSPGSSGGPLLDSTGQVIGITIGGIRAPSVTGLNFFVPVSEALDKLNLSLSVP